MSLIALGTRIAGEVCSRTQVVLGAGPGSRLPVSSRFVAASGSEGQAQGLGTGWLGWPEMKLKGRADLRTAALQGLRGTRITPPLFH